MAEHITGRHHQEVERATSLAIGGALTTKGCKFAYSGQLGEDPYLSAGDRFFPNPGENVRHHEETFKRLEEFTERVFSKAEERRLVVVGHSFGGLLAVKLGLERPDLVAAVKSEAGLQEGYNETIGVKAVKLLVGHADGEEDARDDSAHIREFHEEIAERWSSDVSLSLHSASFDICFPLPQGLRIELPEGQQPRRRIVAPALPFLMASLRHIPGMPPDTELLHSSTFTEHVFLPMNQAEIKDTQRLRIETAVAERARAAGTVALEASKESEAPEKPDLVAA
jgi:hypothetical protein